MTLRLTEAIIQLLSQSSLRWGIRSREQAARFTAVASEYPAIRAQLGHGSTGRANNYDWDSLAQTIGRKLDKGVPLNFLSLPVLRKTMVFGSRRGIGATQKRVAMVEEVFGAETAQKLLAEDWVGKPSITHRRYRTSANRAHHAAHLAAYKRTIGGRLWEAGHVLEWGGGYGNMARLMRAMNPHLTYTIIDLPELLALQFVYLAAVEAKRPHVMDSKDPLEVRSGEINLVSSERIMASLGSIECHAFVSTWALTESPRDAQELVMDQAFFGAQHILMASLLDHSNCMAAQLGRDIVREPIGLEMGIGPGHEYWFR